MAVKNYTASFKTRDDVFDNFTPKNVVQANVSAPAGEWKPAPWLPIQWEDTASKDSFVISSGKIVCLTTDPLGYLVPATYKDLAYGTEAVGDTVITYLARDVTAKVIDVTTGVALTTAKTVTLAQFATAILDQGWVLESEIDDADWANAATFDATSAADCRLVVDTFISAPVGVAAYDVYVWAGDITSAAGLNFHNYQKQHLIMFLTDVQMQVPVHTAMDASGDANPFTTAALNAPTAWAAAGGDGEVFPDGEAAGEELFVTSTALAGLARYAGLITAGDDFYAIALEHSPCAQHTVDRTPVAASASTLVRYRSGGIAALSRAGDWWFDSDVGLLFVHDGGAGGVASTFAAGETVTYYYYDATNPAGAHRYIHAVGPVKPGDYVTYDRQANFVVFDSTTAEAYASGVFEHEQIVGRVLAVVKQPRGLLNRVRTAFEGSSFDKTAQMPGSATKGYTDLITLSDEYCADEVAIINVKHL